MDKAQFSLQKMRDFYAQTPNAPIVLEDFGYYSEELWKSQGHWKEGVTFQELFGWDEPSKHSLGELGWCEGSFVPVFEDKVLEDRGEYELVQDFAGRSVLFFKGRRSGFMPEYVDHPVKDMYTWEKNVKWRMEYDVPERHANIAQSIEWAKDAEQKGFVICQNLVGGYMYLRSLMGPEGALYLFYDAPELIHDCMETWFNLADRVIADFQKHVTLDEIFLAEDICYNHGPLISPDMMREFLFPYYQQLIGNAKKRQLDASRRLYIQIDTDGLAEPVIPVYQEIGMDYMSPFEVASGSDVVAIRKKYPNLLMRGGIDKRILASGREAIAREVDRIMPFMRARGGYIPTCDHGVPEEVPFEDYIYFRELLAEYGR